MEERNLRALVAQLHIIVKRLTSADMSGDFSSAFRGSGLEFAHLRNYEMGDEIRSIDWKSSAKMNRLMVKEFVQERERTVIIAVDLSASLTAGSSEKLKADSARTVAACLAMMAQNTNDKVGLLLFAGTVIKFMPPRKGATYNTQLVHEILSADAIYAQSNINAPLNHLANIHLRNAIVFIVSDWILPTDQSTALLAFIGNKNETVAVRIMDPLERALPSLGLLPIIDPESGELTMINTASSAGRTLNAFLAQRLNDQKNLLNRNKIAILDIVVGSSLIDSLVKFFHTRAH